LHNTSIKDDASKFNVCVCNKTQTWVGVLNTDIWQQHINFHYQKEKYWVFIRLHPAYVAVSTYTRMCLYLTRSFIEALFSFGTRNHGKPIKQQSINLYILTVGLLDRKPEVIGMDRSKCSVNLCALYAVIILICHFIL
jgi:hypothetical protein